MSQAARWETALKNCIFCAEEIQDAAIKCRFCGEMQNSSAAERNDSKVAAVDLSPADFQKAVDQINNLLQAQEPARAMRESLALRERVKTAANAEELKSQLESLNQSINQLSKISPAASAVAKVGNQSSMRLFTVTCITVSLLCLGYIGKNHSDIRAYSKASAAVVDDLDKIGAATQSGVNLLRFSEKLNDLTYSWNRFEETNRAYAETNSYKKLRSAVLDYRLAKDSWELKNTIRDDALREAQESNNIQIHWAQAHLDVAEAKAILAKEASFPLAAISACVIPIVLLGVIRFTGRPSGNAVRIAVYGGIAVCLFLAYKSYTEETARLLKP